jgi:phosphate transport system protein
MLHDALESFTSNDVRIAHDVLERDDKLDRLENNEVRDFVTSMIHDRRTIEPALNLVLISRHLERVGDHATNIAEDVIFIVAGQDVRHHATAGS